MNKKSLIDAAMSREKADLVIKNGNIIDVLGHRIIKGNIGIKDGYIIGIGDYEGINEYDATGKFIAPGFIDSHIHIESSMCNPSEYAKLVLPYGVTAIVADPHEIANVCGEKGIKYMLDDAKDSVIDMFFMLPSCVPATPFEHSGAVINSSAVKELLNKYDFLGLAEMMNSPGVIYCDEDVLSKLESCSNIDGHAPLLSGKELNAYVCGGISNDHECSNTAEAEEKLSKGLNIFVREGTGAKNIEGLLPAVNPYNLRHFTFCTDDKNVCEILTEGTISHCISKAVSLGLDAVSAHTMASYNAAEICSLGKRGAIAPGFIADLVIMEDKAANKITRVYKNGKLAAENGKIVLDNKSSVSTEAVKNTVNIKSVTADDFKKKFDKNEPVIEIHSGSLITTACYENSPDGLSLCANIERHKASGNIGLCYVKGFSLNNGAIAQTIGHDSHNITVIGDNAADMALAVNSLGKNGGIVVVKNGKVISDMVLEIGGLMSAKGAEAVADDYRDILKSVKEICVDGSATLMMILSFVSLLVIPHIKLSDRGLFDVDSFRFIKD